MDTPDLFIPVFKAFSGALVGGILGSFVSMLIYRVPRGLSIIAPRSFCNSCKRTLEPRDLVPVFSYLINRGRCRFCGAGIGVMHVAIELLCIAIGALIAISIT